MKTLNGLRVLDGTSLTLTSSSGFPITIANEQLGYQHINTGLLVFTPTGVFFRQGGVDYHILHENSNINVKVEDADQNKIVPGQIIPAGDNAKKQASPAPFVFIDTTGRLGSDNLWNPAFTPNIMGYVDIDKPNTYAQGIVRAGSATHGGLFLRKDGQWGLPSVYTGSVAETLLSLQDTPITYTGHLDKYLRVSYAEGGSVVFDAIDTSKVAESTNLYYTDARVESKILQKATDGSLTSMRVAGRITATEFVGNSDRRLKRSIANLDAEKCTEAVAQLQPKSYCFNECDRKRFGFISQEVDCVLPELVCKSGAYQSLNYIDLIPVLVGAIQDLQVQVKNLSSKI